MKEQQICVLRYNKIYVPSRAYRLKKRACNCTPSKSKPCLKVVTLSTVSIGAKPAKVTKYSINYNCT